MVSRQEQHNEKPVWEVKIRPIGEPETPWETISIHASSILQAEAIMRRRGFEMAKSSAMRSDGQPTNLPGRKYALKPLVCSRCGYALKGLTLDRASVTCTECTYTQPLIAYIPENSGMMDRNHPVIGVFTIIGIIATILFLLLISLPIIYALL